MLERLERIALVGALIDALTKKGSWCGETHIQKVGFFLQELGKVPLHFEYILYKHGPFSFELRDELTSMRADGLLALKMQPYPYGPSIALTKQGERIMGHFSKLLDKHKFPIDFITSKVADKGVAVLERLSTALYVTRETEARTPEERVKKMVELKPHITLEKAWDAVSELDRMIRECEECGCICVSP